MLEQQAVDSDKIFFSDDAHFTLGGYINKQNCSIWGSEDPQVNEERSLHSEKEKKIGPYFFENDDGTTVTVNSKRYGHMITGVGVLWRRQTLYFSLLIQCPTLARMRLMPLTKFLNTKTAAIARFIQDSC